MNKTINKSASVVLLLNDKPLAGQQRATLSQKCNLADITNLINLDWQRLLPNVRSWSVNCQGIYVVDEQSLKDLQGSFLDRTSLTVLLTIDNIKYTGSVLLSSFPINTVFNSELRYQATLIGTGPLEKVEDTNENEGNQNQG